MAIISCAVHPSSASLAAAAFRNPCAEHWGNPVEFFITGRGKVGQDLDTELYELSVKASKLMQGE